MFKRNVLPKLSLFTILIVPFIALIVLAVGLTGYFAFYNGQRAVNEVTGQLQSAITGKIEQQLETFLATPHLINQLNANALQTGLLDINDPAALERYLWRQIQSFDTITSIYLGNPQGGLVDAGREGPGGFLYVIATDDFKRGPFNKYATDAQGNRTDLLLSLPDFDARTRPWYTRAVETGQPVWSDVYILFTGQDLAIAASRPVYGPDNRLAAVVSNDIFLSQLDNFLQGLTIGKSGQAFIMERSGLLLASSSGVPLFTPGQNGQPPQRILAAESASPLIREIARRLGSLPGTASPLTLEITLNNQRHFVQVTPYQDGRGLDWLIAMVIPEADFLAQIRANNRITTALTLAMVGLGIATGLVIVRWVSDSLARLNQAAQSLAEGCREQPLAVNHILEINQLTQAFNAMAARMQQTMDRLTAEVAQRRQAQSQLQAAKDQLEQLVHSVNGIVWEAGEDFTFTFVSQQAEEILGYPARLWLEQPGFWESHIHPEDRATAVAFCQNATRRREAHEFEYRMLAEDGRVVWLHDIVNVKVGQDGRVQLRGIMVDISGRKQLEAQLLQAQKMEAIGRLAGGIAHDFNNILVTIIGYTELAMMNLAPTDKLYADMQHVREAAERAANLTRQILAFSRKQMLSMRVLDLNQIINVAVEIYRRLLGEDIEIQTYLDDSLYPVYADSTQIEQILLNLVINARDAMPGGGIVTLETANVYLDEAYSQNHPEVQPGHYVMLAVSDTGHGMDAQTRGRIFEPFFTTKEQGKGTGLGLAVAFGVIKQHQGHMGVYSEPGQGTTFKIYLPRAREEAPMMSPPPAAEPTVLYGTGTVLLVEDETMVRELIQETLIAHGYTVITAAKPQEALQLAAGYPRPIHLLLTDVIMPGLNGRELYGQLKEQRPGIKVLYMSGYTQNIIGHHGVLDEGVVLLQKPFTTRDLTRRVRAVLESPSSYF